MSEIDLAALAASDKPGREDAAENDKANKSGLPNPMQEVNEVLLACGFGRFHIRLICASFFGISNGVVLTSSIAYVLAYAECDLNMNLLRKGILNAMVFAGMFLTTVVSGFLCDTFGRKLLLITGFGGTTLFMLTTSMSQSFIWICISLFMEGAVFAAAFNPLHAYSVECCHNGIRDRLVLCQASFLSIGVVWLALVSWAILSQDWRLSLFDGAFVLNTWNFYLLLTSIIPLMATILYSLMPESPKYLVLHNRYEEAREVLVKIYKENTGKSADTFPYKDIWKNKQKEQTIYEESLGTKGAWEAFTKQLVGGLHNCKPLFKKPLGGYLLLFSALNFLIMFMYNVFRLWFPQLSTIVEHYSLDPAHNSDLCNMLEGYVEDSYSINRTANEVCVPNKSGTETYINSIILGLICIPPFMVSGILVNRVGKKILLVVFGIITVVATLGLRWSSQKYEVVGLIALDVGLGQIMLSLMQAFTVEVFPTSTRSLGVSVLMMAGRTGTLVGNVTFPLLLNQGCSATFFTLAGIMFVVTLMSFLLPKKKKT